MTNKIEAIIFDIGGVIFRPGDGPPLREKWASRCNLSPEVFDETVYNSPLYAKAATGEITNEELWAFKNQTLNLSPAELEEFLVDYWDGYWDQTLMSYIETLKPHYRLGILSDANTGAREVVQEQIDLTLFDTVTFSYEVGLRKPDPEIFKLTLDRLAVPPSAAIFIDDRPDNVEGARALGMQAILYEEFEPFVNDLELVLYG